MTKFFIEISMYLLTPFFYFFNMAKEAKLDKQVKALAKIHDCLYFKFSSPSNRGVPDRIIIFPNGKLLFMELKAPGERPTDLQMQYIRIIKERTWKGNQIKVTWVDNMDRVRDIFNQLLNG